jgi:hypothetical protein
MSSDLRAASSRMCKPNQRVPVQEPDRLVRVVEQGGQASRREGHLDAIFQKSCRTRGFLAFQKTKRCPSPTSIEHSPNTW